MPGISPSLCVRVCLHSVSAFTHFPHFVACNARTASHMLSLSSKCTPVLTPPSPRSRSASPRHTPTFYLWQRCLNSGRVGVAAPVGTDLTPASLSPFKKVKHSASSFFFVIYAFVLLPLFTLISICKSNHTTSPSQLLVPSGQKPRPTGNSLCKYATVDTRWAAHGAVLLWWDTMIRVQISKAVTLLLCFTYCHR